MALGEKDGYLNTLEIDQLVYKDKRKQDAC